MSGRDVWPIVEGGKGISVSDGRSSGRLQPQTLLERFLVLILG
ncbi:oxidoreductase, 2-nitropropane dioxygenase family [Anaplasma phagocytophilum str. Annie]|nr:oxidoreductase, 2-nitropropane dioxygenase family [Anaplasma phagocytophilum str. Webster]KJV99559.1 oxidoreductase, 2-nitropropane dioxygenase family [Anaplasma phagocytophilum str. Annie]